MEIPRRIFITLFCCFVIAKSEKDVWQNQDSTSQITAVLDYLNSNSNGVYEYKGGYLVDAQNKADIIEVTIEVNVDCLRTYPEIPCNEHVLICNAFIRQNPDQIYQVLSDVKCSPKIEINVEEVDEVKSAAPMVFGEQSQGDMDKIDLSSEALSPAQGGADFVAVRRDNIPCLGCPFELNTDAEGVEELINTAVKHIESERKQRHKIINVRRLQQQVVAGLKYILLAEVAPTMCPKDADLSAPCILDTSVEPFICEITFIEKPWIIKGKHIIKNNCTVSQEYEPVDLSKRDQDDINNEISPQDGFNNRGPQVEPKPVPNYDNMAQTGNMEDEMDADRLADLESQIIFGDMIEVPKVSKVEQSEISRMPATVLEQEYISVDESTPVVPDTEEHLKVEPLNVDDSHFYRIPLFSNVPVIDETEPLVTMHNYQNEEPIKTSGENIVIKDTESYEPSEFESSLPAQERLTRHNKDSKSESDSTSEESKETVKAELKNDTEISKPNIDVRKVELTDNSSEESSESQNTEEKRQRVRRDKPERADNNNKDDCSSSSSSSSDDDDDDKDNNNIRDEDNNTRREKSEKLKKANDEDNNKDDSSSSSSSSSSSDEDNNNGRHKRSIGQMEKISPDEKVIVRDLADFAAATLDNIDDDHHKRVILQILGAKKLKLDGIYYQIILRLGISHCHEHEHNENCREKLFTNLTKICKVQVHVDDDYSNPKVVKSQCQNIKKDENDRNRTNYSRYKRAILVGGRTPTATDNPDVQRLVNATLRHLDSVSDHPNKHKAVEILSATTQIVAGVRYDITVQIGLSDCTKSEKKLPETCGLLEDPKPETCMIDVWERSWLNKTIYHINCNESVFNFSNEDESVRNKREVLHIKGGVHDIPKDSEKVLNHLNRSLVYLDSKSEHENKYIIDEVLSASSQVVAGTLVRIQARIALSDCKKGSELENCTKLNDTLPTICKFRIWEQPWINFTETNVTCDNNQRHSFRGKRSIDVLNESQLLGGDEELSTEHIDAKNFVNMALKYITSKSETPGKYELKTIKKVNRRIVAGALWNIEADIALCQQIKMFQTSYSSCPDSSENLNCHFTVLSQPWHAFGLTINVTCDNDDHVYSYTPVTNEMSPGFDYERSFKTFIQKYKKSYGAEEYNYRFRVFKDNIHYIHILNKYERGTAVYGITEFTDMTEKEFSKSHGYRPKLKNENEVPFAQAKIPDIKIPTEFDWRTKGVVTEVKNQGLCGSCWAFSVTGNVESLYAITTGKLLELSEQELIDCDTVDQGCNGGLMDNAYRAIETLGGLETETDYPYEGDDEKCHFDMAKAAVDISGAVNISHDETDMAKWLVGNAPISIAINANAMQFYYGGISHPWKMLCNPNSLDHGVLIVGYGVHKYALFNKTLPYWIVKNSWGPSWGEQGYYRVYRGDGTCGLNQTPSSAFFR